MAADAVVVDASALVDLLLDRVPALDTVLEGRALLAPELIDVEVLSALRRLSAADILHPQDAAALVERLSSVPVERTAHLPLLPSVWDLRNRVRLTDAWYVALAQDRDVPLVTTDARLSRAALPDVLVVVP